jgi:predicted membrane-bound spermidine synthase
VYYLLFTVSGFAGLIYESIWSHYLKLFLGHAAYAQSLVLMLFMGGLALGSWIVARRGARWQLPILWYAGVEAAIGILALVFHREFVAVTAAFYDRILPAVGNPVTGAVLKWIAASGLILPQSVLLGMTFPLLSAGLLRRYPDNPGGAIAMLYFTNSAGAAVGALASGFWLIGLLGLPGTIRVAALLNLGTALLVALFVVADRARRAPALSAVPPTPASQRTGQVFLLAAFLTGLASFVYEIGWIRMLSLVLGSATHSFELMLSAFISGLALGGLWIRRRIDAVEDPIHFAAWVQVLMGVVAVLSVPVYGAAFGWMSDLTKAISGSAEGYRLYMLASHGIALAVMLPATFLAGMTLPLFTRVMLRDGAGERAIGQVYAANTLGGITGVLLAVHLGLPWLGLKDLIVAGAVLDVLLGLGLLSIARPTAGFRRWVPLGGAAVLGLSAIVAVAVGANLSPKMLASGVYRTGRTNLGKETDVLFYKDGKTATVTVVRLAGNFYSIMTNGKPDAALRLEMSGEPFVDEGTNVLLGGLPLAYSPHPRKAAAIGFGSGLTTSVLLTDKRLDAVDTVEIEPAMIEGARIFSPRVGRAFDDPRSHLHIEDAKTFFPLHRENYDIIVAEPSNPWVSGVASLFSREFYALAARYLADDGVFVQWLQLYEFTDELAYSVFRALDAEFEDYVVYVHANDDAIIVARKKGRLPAPDFTRLFASGAAADLAAAGFRTPTDLALRRTFTRRELTAQASESHAPANSDYFPYVDQNAGAARIRKQAATFLSAGTTGPLPVLEMLTGSPWEGGKVAPDVSFERTASIRTASALIGSLLQGKALPRNVPQRDSLMSDAGAVSIIGRNCELALGGALYLNALHHLMEAMLAYLPPDNAADVVQLAGARCKPDNPATAAWFRVYDAVAHRDAAAMSATAQLLMDAAPPKDERRRAYLLGAMMLGEFAGGHADRAAGHWDRYQGAKLYAEDPGQVPAWLTFLRRSAAIASPRDPSPTG